MNGCDPMAPFRRLIFLNRPAFMTLSEVEHATMMLSKMVGIGNPESDIQEFNGQQTYIVERFDRRIENGMPVRLPDGGYGAGIGPTIIRE